MHYSRGVEKKGHLHGLISSKTSLDEDTIYLLLSLKQHWKDLKLSIKLKLHLIYALIMPIVTNIQLFMSCNRGVSVQQQTKEWKGGWLYLQSL